MIYKTSEWVSTGHPDKISDYVSEYILDRLIELDPKTRYALEVQIKKDVISLAGEITTKADVVDGDFAHWAKEAINEIGYTKKYQEKFGIKNTICGDECVVCCNISKQSPDIAEGVNKDAWGDQGIFFGYYCGETKEGHGKDYYLAKKIGQEIYQKALSSEVLGLDIKTQVTISYDDIMLGDKVAKIICAVPMVEGKEEQGRKEVLNIIKKYKDGIRTQVIINGTGSYCKHGPIADCGTTGRKLAVDFYGGRSRIGGGSPWTKDGTKADLTLNIFAYELAKQAFSQLEDIQPHHVEVELSCCIGQKAVLMQLSAFDNEGNNVYRHNESQSVAPSTLIQRYGLSKPIFAKMCRDGLFTAFDYKKEKKQ